MTGNGASALLRARSYAKSSKMRFNGNGCGYPQNALIIIRTLELNGTNACLTTNYNQIQQRPDPAGRAAPRPVA